VTIPASEPADAEQPGEDWLAGSPLAREPTPALVVDRLVLETNIQAMAQRAERAGMTMWPHAKTHKSLEIARLQRAAGAAGITVATVAEAELFADAGFSNILVAYPPVGAWRAERLARLAGHVRLQVTADSVEVLEPFASACARERTSAEFLWEVDCGVERCGTAPGAETVRAVQSALRSAGPLRFAGLMAFAGHAYGASSDDELAAIAREESEAVLGTCAELVEAGIEAPVMSIGSTPTAHFMLPGARGMSTRPGNYVFYDATQVALGLVGLESCALTVLGTVVSRPSEHRVVLDCGSKALASDRMTDRTSGYGLLVGHPHVTIERLFEEHAIATSPLPIRLKVGDRVRVIPNHACAAANLGSSMLVVDSGAIGDVWHVGARA
jgi:D-serine deaminase-like pyridoxal phosphate-dependent protein